MRKLFKRSLEVTLLGVSFVWRMAGLTAVRDAAATVLLQGWIEKKSLFIQLICFVITTELSPDHA